MELRRGGCMSIPAFLGTAGVLLIYYGKMAVADRPIRIGIFCLIGAAILLGAVLYIRRQGWIE
jgi:hypothetical protein